MAPIRTALIGLSSSAATSWASSAHLPYLLSARGRERYTITALCNSSVDAARRSIAAYGLPPETTKAYGDPRSLAEDPDIDLVVCCTRVDVHHPTSLPSVAAGKDVYVEWPLAQDAARAGELADAARRGGGRTFVGLQGRVAPPLVKIREVLEGGAIGKVLSSDFRAAGGTVDRELLSPGLAYFADRSVGGNVYTIGFAHLFDQIQYVLGDAGNIQAHFQLQRPEVRIRDPSTGAITRGSRTSDVPDLFTGSGTLPESPTVAAGATLSYRYRRGPPFKGEPPLVWSVSGEEGELRLTAWGGAALNANVYVEPVTIEVHDFATDQVREVEWGWEAWQEDLPIVARNIAKVYDDFAAGRPVTTFEDATQRHRQLETMLSAWEA